VGLGTGPTQSAATLPHAWDEQLCLPRPDFAACHVWLVALDVLWALILHCLSYGGHYHCIQGPASLCTHVPVCFPSSPCGGQVRACVACCSFLYAPLPLLATTSDLKLLWTEGPDKLGVGTLYDYKVPWYEFSMGSQGPSKLREGKADRDEGQGSKTREGAERVSWHLR
jgi:hypothetical protein